MAEKLLSLFPPHVTYCEPFGGGASMLFRKAPSPVEVYNELDGTVVNLFRCLQDPAQYRNLERRQRQSEKIRQWRPWEKSTGPRTPEGKARVSRNAYKGGTWLLLRELARALKEQRRMLKRV